MSHHRLREFKKIVKRANRVILQNQLQTEINTIANKYYSIEGKERLIERGLVHIFENMPSYVATCGLPTYSFWEELYRGRGSEDRAIHIYYWFRFYYHDRSHSQRIDARAFQGIEEQIERLNSLGDKAAEAHPKIESSQEDALKSDQKKILQSELREIQEILAITRTLQREGESFYSFVPASTSIPSSFHQLKEIDRKLSRDDLYPAQREALQTEKSDYVRFLFEQDLEKVNIDQFCSSVSSLYRVNHWNNRRAQELKLYYWDLAVLAINFGVSRKCSQAVELIMCLCGNLNVQGKRSEAKKLVAGWRNFLLSSETTWSIEVMIENNDTLMESGSIHPNDLGSIVCGQPKNLINVAKARAWKCRACFFAQLGHFAEARACIDNSRSDVGKVPSSVRDRSRLECYLACMSLLIQWKEKPVRSEGFLKRIAVCMENLERYVRDDAPLYAAMLDLKIQVMNYKSFSGRFDVQEDVQRMSRRINNILLRSIPSYCILNLEDIRWRASLQISDEPFIFDAESNY
ncbi:MAG: hypothetical protein NXH97_22350 [Rhodobacteraceae bacterium]|nr:hypothetical protein [Paracoccaceae bacterium]